MKAIRIYTQDSKYFMEDLENNTVHELTETIYQKKDNTTWFKLPENSANRSLVCKESIDKKGTITREHKDSIVRNNKTKTPKVDLNEYYTDEEKAQIEKLQAKIDKINEVAMARAQKDLKKNELRDTLKALDPDTLKAIMAELMGGEA